MSKKNLYQTFYTKNRALQIRDIMNILSFCDGEHSLLDIAEKIKLPAWHLYEIVEKLILEDLISPT
jgi:aminopeptidase-like protein